MRQFQQHWDRLAPLPNTTNSSGSAVLGAKLLRSIGNHIGAMLDAVIGGPLIGHAAGAAVGEGIQQATRAVRNAREIGRTKDLFLGKRDKVALNKNY